MRKFKKIARWIIILPIVILLTPVIFVVWISEDTEQGYFAFIMDFALMIKNNNI